MSEHRQTEFPFADQVRPQRDWWTRPEHAERLEESMRAYEEKQQAIEDAREPCTVILITCSKSKLDRPAPARELYTGPLFKKSVAWAERQGHRWFVVSARYGLLKPDEVRPPYNFTMNDWRGAREKEQWAHGVVTCELTRYAKRGSHAILLLPKAYRIWLESLLLRKGITYDVPLEGLGIGQQMKWLGEH
jgi:hypothetical protein